MIENQNEDQPKSDQVIPNIEEEEFSDVQAVDRIILFEDPVNNDQILFEQGKHDLDQDEQAYFEKYTSLDIFDKFKSLYLKYKIHNITPEMIETNSINLNDDLRNVYKYMDFESQTLFSSEHLFPNFCGFSLLIAIDKVIVYREKDLNCTEYSFDDYIRYFIKYDDENKKIQFCMQLLNHFSYYIDRNMFFDLCSDEIDFFFNPDNGKIKIYETFGLLDLDGNNNDYNAKKCINYNKERFFLTFYTLLKGKLSVNIPSILLEIIRAFYLDIELNSLRTCEDCPYIYNFDSCKKIIIRSEYIRTELNKISKAETKFYKYLKPTGEIVYYNVKKLEKLYALGFIQVIKDKRIAFPDILGFWEEEGFLFFFILDKLVNREKEIIMFNNILPIYSLSDFIIVEFHCNEDIYFYNEGVKLEIITNLLEYYSKENNYVTGMISDTRLRSIYFDDNFHVALVLEDIEEEEDYEEIVLFELLFDTLPKKQQYLLIGIIKFVGAILSSNKENFTIFCKSIELLSDYANDSMIIKELKNQVDYFKIKNFEFNDDSIDKFTRMVDDEVLTDFNGYIFKYYEKSYVSGSFGQYLWKIPNNQKFYAILQTYGWSKYCLVPQDKYHQNEIIITEMKPIDLLRRLKIEFTIVHESISKIVGCEYDSNFDKIIIYRDIEHLNDFSIYNIRFSHSETKKMWIKQLIGVVQYMNRNNLLFLCENILFRNNDTLTIPDLSDVDYNLELSHDQICNFNSKHLQFLLKSWFKESNNIDFPITIKKLIYLKKDWEHQNFSDLQKNMNYFPYIKYQVIELLKDFKLYKTYRGNHCEVMFYKKNEEKYVIKKYNGYNEEIIHIISMGGDFTSHVICCYYDDGCTYFLVEYISSPFVSLDPTKAVQGITENIKRKLVNCRYFHYFRWNPDNIFLNYGTGEIKIVDFIPLTSDNIDDYFDNYCSPLCLYMKKFKGVDLIFIDYLALNNFIKDYVFINTCVSKNKIKFFRLSFRPYFEIIYKRKRNDYYLSLFKKYIIQMEITNIICIKRYPIILSKAVVKGTNKQCLIIEMSIEKQVCQLTKKLIF